MQPIKVKNLNRLHADYFQLIVYICDKCNYNCKCCYNEKPRSCVELDLNVLFEYISFLHSNLYQHIEINFLGGEPTLHSQLIDFCKKISKFNDIDLIIYSNGSQSIRYYEYLLNLKNIRFDLSYHTINEKRNVDYIRKIIQLSGKNYSHGKLNITLMLENGYAFEDLKKINSLLMKLKINKKHNIDYRLIRDFSNIDNMSYYSNSELDYFSAHYINFNKIKTFNVQFDNGIDKQFSIEEFDINTFCKFNNWNCNAGKETLYCHCDGNVYNCQSQYIENNDSIFNLYQKFELPKKTSLICKCKNCRIDCEITKWK